MNGILSTVAGHRRHGAPWPSGRVAAGMLVTALFFTLNLPALAQPPLRIAYPEFPPFHWVGSDGRMTGFFYDIITEALERKMGVHVVWAAYPWTRCQENLKRGLEDAILTVPTAERAEYTVTHPHPFYWKTLHVFTCADHPRLEEIRQLRSLEDLKRDGFSVITYSGNGWNKENVQSAGVRTYETAVLENIWKMLEKKRGDIVIEWPPGAWPDIRLAGLQDRIVDTGVRLSAMPFHLLIRKDSPFVSLLDDFDKTVRKMYNDGTIQSIVLGYQSMPPGGGNR